MGVRTRALALRDRIHAHGLRLVDVIREAGAAGPSEEVYGRRVLGGRVVSRPRVAAFERAFRRLQARPPGTAATAAEPVTGPAPDTATPAPTTAAPGAQTPQTHA